MKKSSILVSGADGYIASYLIRGFRALGFSVHTASRSQNGELYLDFSQPAQIAGASISGIKTMLHTVSPNEALFKADPCRAAAENAAGIHAALDFCVRNHIENFIYFSSFHVFGNRGGLLDEATPPSPGNDYGLGHLVSEQTVMLYDRLKKLNGWILRPSNLFGVPVDLDRFRRWNLIPFAFCAEAVRKKSITLLTPGKQMRNFVGIGDVFRKTAWILENAPSRRIFHAYGNETISVYEYARRVQAISSEIIGEPVLINRPDGGGEAAPFSFTSLETDPELLPRDYLDDFIRELSVLLAARQERDLRLK